MYRFHQVYPNYIFRGKANQACVSRYLSLFRLMHRGYWYAFYFEYKNADVHRPLQLINVSASVDYLQPHA